MVPKCGGIKKIILKFYLSFQFMKNHQSTYLLATIFTFSVLIFFKSGSVLCKKHIFPSISQLFLQNSENSPQKVNK
jgi:hypothetical protein